MSTPSSKQMVLWNCNGCILLQWLCATDPHRSSGEQAIVLRRTGRKTHKNTKPLFYGEQGERPIKIPNKQKIPKPLFYGEQGVIPKKIPKKYQSHCSTANRAKFQKKYPKNPETNSQ
jgi:hypothetical protein